MHYRIILDEQKLDHFLTTLPELQKHEVWYICLFGRHKYDPAFPNTKDSGQLARVVAKNAFEFKEKLRRMEAPIGSFTREHGGGGRATASQDCLAVYATMNPRSLIKANKALLVELATRIADGQNDFNPISLSTTSIHRAVDRKFFVDFDFDGVDPEGGGLHTHTIQDVFPDPEMYRILKTRGGFHLLVVLDKVRGLKTKWHQTLSTLPGCDVRGSDTLTPVPGCTQGGFVPYFLER